MKNPIVFQDEEEEEEKEGTQKKMFRVRFRRGFRVATHDGNKHKKSGRKRLGAYKNDCHEYYALSSGAFNDEIVLGVTYTS